MASIYNYIYIALLMSREGEIDEQANQLVIGGRLLIWGYNVVGSIYGEVIGYMVGLVLRN